MDSLSGDVSLGSAAQSIVDKDSCYISGHDAGVFQNKEVLQAADCLMYKAEEYYTNSVDTNSDSLLLTCENVNTDSCDLQSDSKQETISIQNESTLGIGCTSGDNGNIDSVGENSDSNDSVALSVRAAEYKIDIHNDKDEAITDQVDDRALKLQSQTQGYLLYDLRDGTLSISIPQLAVQAKPLLVLENSEDRDGFQASVILDQTKVVLGAKPNDGRVRGRSFGASQNYRASDGSEAIAAAMTGDQGLVYQCTVQGCGRTFSTPGYLKYHQAVHGNQHHRQLKCDEPNCGRVFSWLTHLKYHKLTHGGERRFVCEQPGCNQKFFTAQRLGVHMRTHTGEKPYECVSCGKAFTTAGNLRNHTRTHTGEKPYTCHEEGCGKQFAEYSSLCKHKITHTGQKPHVCPICDKSFSQSGSRNIHMKKHKRQKVASTPPSHKLLTLQEELDELPHPNQTLILHHSEEDEELLQYQDFPTSEPVVFSHPVSDHVVTVTTQPADGETDHLELTEGIMKTEELKSDCRDASMVMAADKQCSASANVVVLSQPQDMVTITTASYHNSETNNQEDMVFDSDFMKDTFTLSGDK